MSGRHFAQKPEDTGEVNYAPPRTSGRVNPQPERQQYAQSSYIPLSETGRGFDPFEPEDGGHGHAGAVIGGIIAALVVIAAVFGFMMMGQVKEVKTAAQDMMAQKEPLAAALKTGNAQALDSSIQAMQTDAAKINETTHSRLWNIAGNLPIVGQDVRSAQTLGAVAEDLVDNALVPVGQSARGMKMSDLVQDGAVNVEEIEQISGSVSTAIPTLKKSISAIEELPDPVLPQMKEVMDKVKPPLEGASESLDQLEPALKLLPQMLGGNGAPRHYLLIAQNNSELRSTGGLPGSWSTLTVNNGVISMGDSTSILHQPGFSVPVQQDELSTLAIDISKDPAQVNCTPDFVRVGEMSSQYWAQAGNGDVDGVIAIDPIFLQRLLALTGPIKGPDGTEINGDNCSQVLLSDVYWKYPDGDTQDVYFSKVAGAAFQSIIANLGKPGFGKLMQAVHQSGKEGRLLVWMRNQDEESLMEGLSLSGGVPTDIMNPVLGVYVNDDTYSKITWYTGVSTTVGAATTNADGTITYDVKTVLSNNITPNEAASAPKYVYGGNPAKRSRGDMLTYLFLFAPAGGSISDVSTNDSVLAGGQAPATGQMYGLSVVRIHLQTLEQTNSTITYKVTCAAGSSPLALRTTPLAQPNLMQNSVPGTEAELNGSFYDLLDKLS